MKASAFVTIIALNNRGVDCFNNDRVECASKYFRETLHILRTVLAHSIAKNESVLATCHQERSHEDVPSHLNRSDPNQTVETQTRAIAVENAVNTTTQQPHSSMSLTTTYTDSSPLSALPMSSLYISTQPVKLEASSVDRKRTARRASIATLVVSFNLGLAHHLMSFTSSPEKADSYARSAIAFYEVALTLRRKSLKREERHGGRLPSNVISMLELSIINNIAVLYDQVGNYGRARGCFERLVVLVNRVDANSMTNDVHGFVGNIAIIGTYLLRILPAAAA